MIKIKNHIYNENEIISINESTENDSISIKFKTDSYFLLENTTFEDIEWNYENNISESLSYDLAKARIKELEEENKILKENAIHNDKVVDEAKWNENLYKSRIDKAIEYIENAYEEEYHKPKEVIKTFNLKNCTYEPSLVVLGILKGEENEE